MKSESFWRNSTGGVALEATLVFPIFSAFLFAMMSFMLIAVSDIALYAAVSETTKQVAAHGYPIDLVVSKAAASERGQRIAEWAERIKEWRSKLSRTSEWFDTYARFLPEPFVNAIAASLQAPEQWQQTLDKQFQEAMSAAFRPLFLLYADKEAFFSKREGPRITRVELPSWSNRDEAYFGLEAECRMMLPIPFIRKEVVLKQSSLERLWVGL